MHFAPTVLLPLALALVVQPQGGPQGGPQDVLVDAQTILVTPGRGSAPSIELPYSAHLVDEEQLERRSYRTTPQALRDIPGVMVQETAHGQGSPFLRGFTGFRNLFLIDGVRLNNSVFRDGPNQYWNTVDPFSLRGLEVSMGPGSALYGSDAIGGTVQALTKNPWAWGEPDRFGAEIFYRGASAEESNTLRAEGSASSDNTGVLIGVTTREFGDLQGGNSIGTQPNTGYDELAGDLKVEHWIDPSTRLVFLHQRFQQDDVPRTHRTTFAVPFEGTTVGSDRRRDLDQRRSLSYVQLHSEGRSSGVDAFHASLSWHEQEEERTRVRADGRTDEQGFDVGTLGLQAQWEAFAEEGRLTVGFDVYRDRVESFRRDLANLADVANTIQGPVADDAIYETLGIFAQKDYEATERTTVTLGARFEYAAVDADEVRDPTTDEPITVEDDWDALVGNVRVSYALTPPESARRWQLFGGISQGFRAPNLSDLTRFDSARSNEFEIPATDLEPENFVSVEAGVKAEGEGSTIRAATFFTDIDDLIVRVPTGNTNADGETEISKDNLGDGEVWGIELDGSLELAPEWSLFAATAWLDGEVSTFPSAAPVLVDEPIDRLMPWTSQIGLAWESSDAEWWAEAMIVHAEDADELSSRDAADTSRIPPGGTPGYTVGSIHAGWRAMEQVDLFFGVDNVTDEDYRVHGSGSNSAGTNFIVGVRATL